MKTSFLAAIAAVLLAAVTPGIGAPKAFEGKVTYQVNTGRGIIHMTYYAKGDRVRTEVTMGEGQSAVMLLDYGKHEQTMLIPAQKMYMVRSLPTPSAPAEPEETAPAAKFEANLRHTGEYKTILGRKCEKIVVKSGDRVTEVWGAEDMGVIRNATIAGPMGRGGSAARSAWETQLQDHGFFPLRVIARDASGHEVTRMDVTAIDLSPPPDSLFVPPPDYKKFAMPAMPGMGGASPFHH